MINNTKKMHEIWETAANTGRREEQGSDKNWEAKHTDKIEILEVDEASPTHNDNVVLQLECSSRKIHKIIYNC